MFRSFLKNESGYSLVEVIVSILILMVAIVPMVRMFDAGLRTASSGGDYDKVRAFANERLEFVKTVPYAAARDNFPVASSTPGATPPGRYTSPTPIPLPASVEVSGSYVVTKQYVTVQPNVATANLQNHPSDSRMMRITITVTRGGKPPFSVSGVVSGGVT